MTPVLDGLEIRNLMTGNISLSAGIVSVVGDAAASSNLLSVSYNDPAHTQVSVFLREDGISTEKDFQISDVTKVDFVGQGKYSNMFVNVTDVNDSAKAGDGYNYFLVTGNGDNTFVGGNGVNIFLDYGGGRNNFTGGDGYNVFVIGNGDSTLKAGNGTNYIVAGHGNDTITTGTGTNYIWRT